MDEMKGGESSSSVDDKKRGREQDDVTGDIFRKSKRTTRSPLKSHRDNEEKLNQILNTVQEMKEVITEMRKEQQEYREEMLEIKRENENLKREFELSRRENEEIRGELNSLKKTIDRLEREKREKNVVLTGLKMDTADTKTLRKSTENFLEQHLEVKVKVKAAHRLGQNTCLIQLENLQDKEDIMRNKQKLRKLSSGIVFINNDLSVEERIMQKQIRERAREERKRGKTVKVGFHKIVIEGEEWKWNRNLNKLEKAKN